MNTPEQRCRDIVNADLALHTRCETGRLFRDEIMIRANTIRVARKAGYTEDQMPFFEYGLIEIMAEFRQAVDRIENA